jgi:hypothetical protein
LLIAGAGLLIALQTRDMLAALDGTIGGKSSTFWFHLSLAILSLSAWYWARALLNARFDVRDNKASREALRKADDRLKPFAFVVVGGTEEPERPIVVERRAEIRGSCRPRIDPDRDPGDPVVSSP